MPLGLPPQRQLVKPKLKLPPSPRLSHKKIISPEEMQKLFDATPKRYNENPGLIDLRWGSDRNTRILRDCCLLAILYHVGGRINEILSLQRRHLSQDEYGRLRVYIKYSKRSDRKGERHHVPMSKKATFRSHIEKYLEILPKDPETMLFKLTPVSAWMIVSDAFSNAYPARSVKEKISPHSARHTRATRIAEAGGTLGELMAWMGWKSPGTAQHYIDTSGVQLDSISEASSQ